MTIDHTETAPERDTDAISPMPNSFDIEGQLTQVEGLAAALKIVGWHEANADNRGDGGALHVLIDQLGGELEKLRRLIDDSSSRGHRRMGRGD